MVFLDVLPRWERCFYWIAGVGSIFYSIYRLFLEGSAHTEELKQIAYFTSGWSWVGRVKDETDYDVRKFRSMMGYMIQSQAGHSLLTLACLHLKLQSKTRAILLLMFDVSAACIFFNHWAGVWLISAGLLMYGASHMDSVLLIWALGLPMFFYSADIVNSLLPVSRPERFFVVIANSTAKLIGFNLDKIWCKRKYAREKAVNFNRETGQISPEEDVQSDHFSSFAQPEKVGPRVNTPKDHSDLLVNNHIEYSDLFFNNSTEHSSSLVNNQTENPSLLINKPAAHVRAQKLLLPEVDSGKSLSKDDDQPESSTVKSKDVWPDRDPNLIDQFFYIFYLPTLFIGPIIPYKDFHQSFHHSFNETTKIWGIVKDAVLQLVKICLYWVLVNLMFHFLYFKAITTDPDIVSSLSEWARYSLVYCQGQYFMVVYFIIYGMALQFSRIDGINDWSSPRCVSWVAPFSDMWRYFDVGIYKFVNRYIYKAVGGSRFGVLRQLTATALGFVYFFVWHGSTMRMFIWCLINYLVVIAENYGKRLEHSSLGVHTKSYLGAAMYLRLKVFLATPFHVASIFSVCFFFFKESVAWVMVERSFQTGSVLNYCLVIYCCIHNAYYIAEIRHTCSSKKSQ